MKRAFRVAAAQMAARRAMPEAAEAVVRVIHRAAARGARFLVTPEMYLTGYHATFDQDQRDCLIENVIAPACQEAGITLLLGAGSHLDARGCRMKKPYIQTVVIGPSGSVIGLHNKTVPTGGDLKWCRGGRLRDLRVFRSQGLTFGATICNDFWATPVYTTLPDPNIPVRLAKLGARVIFQSINSGHGKSHLDFHTIRMEERAIRAGVWVVSAQCVTEPRKPVSAPTGIVGPDGVWRVRAPLTGERLVDGIIRP
ncbi:MAG: carbon-nitrogen hydrolase family protein [Candidatus Coatesbacteria bacterium]